MDFIHLCRFCLKISHYHSNIFTEKVSSIHLYRLINNIFEVKVFRNDGLPEYLCKDCFHTITEFLHLKTQVKESESALMKMKRNENMIETSASSRDEEMINSSRKEKRHIEENSVKMEIEADGMIVAGHENGYGLISEVDIKNEVDVEEIEILADPFEIQKILEHQMDESASLEHSNEMQIIPAGEEKSKVAIKEEIVENPVPNELISPKEAVERDLSASSTDEEMIISSKKEKRCSEEFLEVRRRMECHHCGEKRDTKQEIAQHIEDAHYSISNKINTPIQQQRKDKKHTCSTCERRFKYKYELARHMIIHSGEKPFQCNICNYSSSHRGCLKDHMQIHSGEKPFQCNICNYSCSRSGNLKVHMRIHSGEKPFKCNFCNYRSVHSGHLRRHIRMHTGEKPFHCNICNFTCSSSGILKRHMQTHSGEKPFQCNICYYSCSNSGHLKIHMRKHSGEKPFKCNICSYTCCISGRLKVHMRTHSEEKPFQCKICSYTSSFSWNLKVHMRKHPGENK